MRSRHPVPTTTSSSSESESVHRFALFCVHEIEFSTNREIEEEMNGTVVLSQGKVKRLPPPIHRQSSARGKESAGWWCGIVLWYKIVEEMVCAVIHSRHVYKQSRKVL